MPLLTINDPEKIAVIVEVGLQGHAVVELQGAIFDYSLLKFGQHGCCEVLGYQLAPRLRVPVIPAVPVWCPNAFSHKGQAAGEGRIGLAIQYSETFEHVTWEQAASQAPEAVAASLVLCLLAQGEWGQLAKTKFGLVFYDLEGLFPVLYPERMDYQSWGDVGHELSHAAEAYRSYSSLLISKILDEAERLCLIEPFRKAVQEAATISEAELLILFDLEPHPLAAHIAKIAADIATMQFRHTAQLLCG